MHRPRQDHPLDVRAEPGQVVDGVPMIDPHHVLLDDRAVVEFLGDVVRGRADQLHAALLARRYGAAPTNAGRNEWWMLITGHPTAQEAGR